MHASSSRTHRHYNSFSRNTHAITPSSRMEQFVITSPSINGLQSARTHPKKPSNGQCQPQAILCKTLSLGLILFGGTSLGLAQSLQQTAGLTDGAPNSWFGKEIGTADMNNDGVPDIIAGAPGDNRVFIYNGATKTQLYLVQGPAASMFGYSVSAAGDVNGDGWKDVLVGAPEFAGQAGRATVYSGSTLPTTQATIFDLQGYELGGRFGHSVSIPGDLDQDGFAEVAVGAPWHGTNNEGACFIYSHVNATAPFYNYNFTFGGAVNENHGWVVRGLGDHVGDSRPDFAVGAPSCVSNPLIAGKVKVYDGHGNLVTTHLGPAAGDYFGHSLDSAGDVNLDGRPDLIIGAPRYLTDKGFVKLVLSGGLPPQQFIGNAGQRIGAQVAGFGDVDGDGDSDFGYSDGGFVDPWYLANFKNIKINVYSGSITGAVFPLGLLNEPGILQPASIAAADLNGDGRSDLIRSSIKTQFPQSNNFYIGAGYIVIAEDVLESINGDKAPQAIQGLQASTDSPVNVLVQWIPMATCSSYKLRRNGSLIATLDSTSKKFVDVPPVGTHIYDVRAVNENGEGPSVTALGVRTAGDYSLIKLDIPATSNLHAAGASALPASVLDRGIFPPGIGLPASSLDSVVRFTKVTGLCNPEPLSGLGWTGPDGYFAVPSDISAKGALSGIRHDGRAFFLAGVFLDDFTPGGLPPATPNFTNADHFLNYYPTLRQVFFIGDGRTEAGVEPIQRFHVPPGATRLYLGFADSSGDFIGSPSGYTNNLGKLSVELNIGTTTQSGLGGGVPGTFGTPSVNLSGSLHPGSALQIQVSNARPNSIGAFVYGSTFAGFPLSTGYLVPFPDASIAFTASPAGSWSTSLSLPSSLPSGLSIYYQTVHLDPVAAGGISASNGFVMITP